MMKKKNIYIYIYIEDNNNNIQIMEDLFFVKCKKKKKRRLYSFPSNAALKELKYLNLLNGGRLVPPGGKEYRNK